MRRAHPDQLGTDRPGIRQEATVVRVPPIEAEYSSPVDRAEEPVEERLLLQVIRVAGNGHEDTRCLFSG